MPKEEYYGETCESKKLNMEVILKHEIPNIKKEIYPWVEPAKTETKF